MDLMRLWHGKVAIEKADEYEKFMIEKAAPDYSSVEGLLKLYFQRKNETEVRLKKRKNSRYLWTYECR